MAILLGSFAQQVVSLEDRTVMVGSGNTSFLISQVYDSGVQPSTNCGDDAGLPCVETALQGAIMNGIFNLDSRESFNCAGQRCSWKAFSTLGICGSCQNVTLTTEKVCSPATVRPPSQACNYTTPGSLTMDAQIVVPADGGTFRTRLNFTAKQYDNYYAINHPGIITLAMMRFIDYKAPPIPTPEIFECEIKYCAKVYTNLLVEYQNVNPTTLKT